MPRSARRPLARLASPALVFAVAASVLAPAAASGASSTSTSGFGVSEYLTVIDHHAKPAYKIDFAYPQLVGDVPARTTINRALKGFVDTSVAAFQQQVDDAGPPPPSLPAQVATATLTNLVTTNVLTRQLVGFTFSAYSFPAGAAHGITAISTFTFDPKTGARIELSSLFRRGSPWLRVLSAQSRSRLPAVLGAGDVASMLDPGTTPKASNFSGWALSPFGLELTFGNYQVAPYAAGTPSILIPFSAFGSVLAPRGPSALAAARGPVRMALLPARTPSVTAECDETVSYATTVVPTPLSCGAPRRVNVAAWQAYAEAGSKVLALGRQARLVGVHRAMCADEGRFDSAAFAVGAAKLASAYYGWRFSTPLGAGFPKLCRSLH